MNPLLRARCKVDKAGENKAAWAKATSSAGVAEPMVASAEWSTGGAGVGIGRAKCHNKVLGVRCPVRTTVSLTETVTAVAVKATEHPASHNWPMEMREEEASSGTMWMWRAAGGSMGKSRSASCVEVMMVPLGVRMEIGLSNRRLLMTGASMVPKWAVLPVSAMAS